MQREKALLLNQAWSSVPSLLKLGQGIEDYLEQVLSCA
jgi:hypothetical protein